MAGSPEYAYIEWDESLPEPTLDPGVQYELVDLDTARPRIRIGEVVYEGRWEETVGTFVALSKPDSPLGAIGGGPGAGGPGGGAEQEGPSEDFSDSEDEEGRKVEWAAQTHSVLRLYKIVAPGAEGAGGDPAGAMGSREAVEAMED